MPRKAGRVHCPFGGWLAGWLDVRQRVLQGADGCLAPMCAAAATACSCLPDAFDTGFLCGDMMWCVVVRCVVQVLATTFHDAAGLLWQLLDAQEAAKAAQAAVTASGERHGAGQGSWHHASGAASAWLWLVATCCEQCITPCLCLHRACTSPHSFMCAPTLAWRVLCLPATQVINP